jgi:hypothetical protein
MWLEICLTIVAVAQVCNLLVGFARYHKDYQVEDEEEEMSEEVKRMFS